MIERLLADGTTILLTTQYLEEADRLADRIAVIDGGTVIAEGTASELKDRLGEDVVDLRIVDHARTDDALELLRPLAATEPRSDPGSGRISLPVHHGAGTLAEVVRRIDGAGLEVAELSLHRPSLDDVFLSLTGHRAEEAAASDVAPAAAESSRRRFRGRRRVPPVTATSTAAPVSRPAPRTARSPLWIATDSLTITWRWMLAVVRTPSSSWSTRSPRSCSSCSSRSSSAARSRRPDRLRDVPDAGDLRPDRRLRRDGTAVGLAEDLQKGIIDRFRSLPMAPSAVLIGKTTADLIRNAYTVLIMTVWASSRRWSGGTVPTWIVTIPPDIPTQRIPTRPASRMISAIRSGGG